LFTFLPITVVSSLANTGYLEEEEDDSDEQELETHTHGQPLSLMNFENNSFIVEYEKIDQIFLHPEVANRKIVVVSIIGAFRKGKSFLMDYCLRFMYANVSVF
jgi:Guanylate-binding protein, N-terminal domain